MKKFVSYYPIIFVLNFFVYVTTAKKFDTYGYLVTFLSFLPFTCAPLCLYLYSCICLLTLKFSVQIPRTDSRADNYTVKGQFGFMLVEPLQRIRTEFAVFLVLLKSKKKKEVFSISL